jgi:hypothetical protein
VLQILDETDGRAARASGKDDQLIGFSTRRVTARFGLFHVIDELGEGRFRDSDEVSEVPWVESREAFSDIATR